MACLDENMNKQTPNNVVVGMPQPPPPPPSLCYMPATVTKFIFYVLYNFTNLFQIFS